MPIQFVSGDPTLTRAQTLAFSHNARGRIELGPLQTALARNYPAAFSSYTRRCRSGHITAGAYWIWRESTPMLAFLVVRESSVGATRLRHVQHIALTLARDYRLENIRSLAIAPLGTAGEETEIRKVLHTWFSRARFPVIVYETYQPGIQAEETLLDTNSAM
ncbi:MAG: hypothetical protein OHK0046_10850 [Anaerolineae bacterium]